MAGSFGGAKGVFAARGRRDNLALVEGVAGLDPFAGGRIETNVRVDSADSKIAAEVIFDYQDAQNYRSVRIDRNRKRLVVGQVGDLGEAAAAVDDDWEQEESKKDESSFQQLAVSPKLTRIFAHGNRWHHLRIDIDAATGSVKVYIDGAATPSVTATVAVTGIGRVGLAVQRPNRKVYFGDYQVWGGTALP
jgi:hypothetical protein